jgi:hypothetical protein
MWGKTAIISIGFYELSAFSPFDYYFPYHDGRAIREFFIIYQFP